MKWGGIWPAAPGNISHFSAMAVKLANRRVESGQNCALAPVLYHRHFDMIVGGTLKKSFAGFVRFFLVCWGYDRILDADSQILRADEKRRWCSNEYVNGQ